MPDLRQEGQNESWKERSAVLRSPGGLALELPPLRGAGSLVPYPSSSGLGCTENSWGSPLCSRPFLTPEGSSCLSPYACTLHSLFWLLGSYFAYFISMCLILNIHLQISFFSVDIRVLSIQHVQLVYPPMCVARPTPVLNTAAHFQKGHGICKGLSLLGHPWWQDNYCYRVQFASLMAVELRGLHEA